MNDEKNVRGTALVSVVCSVDKDDEMARTLTFTSTDGTKVTLDEVAIVAASRAMDDAAKKLAQDPEFVADAYRKHAENCPKCGPHRARTTAKA